MAENIAGRRRLRGQCAAERLIDESSSAWQEHPKVGEHKTSMLQDLDYGTRVPEEDD